MKGFRREFYTNNWLLRGLNDRMNIVVDISIDDVSAFLFFFFSSKRVYVFSRISVILKKD